MPQSKNAFVPREGQAILEKNLEALTSTKVSTVQWPTGYGKTIGFAMTWKFLKESGRANRILYVAANDLQREQAIEGFAEDCDLVGVPCEKKPWKYDRSAGDVRAAMDGRSEVFVCSVHQLANAFSDGAIGVNILKDILTARGTSWFVAFDEYQHYGEGMVWGEAAKKVIDLVEFSMGMSATPYRRGANTVFPKPSLIVTYNEAAKAKRVKPIGVRSYEYKVTTVSIEGEPTDYTTSELMEMADGKLSVYEERRQIRYSPQYLHPLITHPLQRLNETRGKYFRGQMLIRAMSCSHAKLVCDQVRMFAKELNVEWIGTGENGRTPEENRAAIKGFCPEKNEQGIRANPTVHILVQVAMAGEGFDSVDVVEIVDLFPVSKKAESGRATQDKQFYGRGARVMKGCEGIPLNISVPTDHPLSKWVGYNVHEWMDAAGDETNVEPTGDKVEVDPDNDWTFPDVPVMRDVEFIEELSEAEEEHIERFTVGAEKRGMSTNEAKDLFMETRAIVAKKESEQMHAEHLRIYIDGIIGKLAYALAKHSDQVSGSVIGMNKKKLNGAIKKRFGKNRDSMLKEELEAVAGFLKNLYESSNPDNK